MLASSCTLVRGLLAVAVASLASLMPTGAVQAQPTTMVEADLVVALPAALPTGLSTGVGVGFAHGGTFAWGVRASWSTATEYTLAWEVADDDFRGRVFGAVQHVAGLGTLALRLGVGTTLVHETRTRTQGARAGLSGNELRTSTWALLPAADLEAVILLHVLPAWSVVVSGGPSLHLLDGEARAGWTGSVGIGWEP
jgi:hypothetical protein